MAFIGTVTQIFGGGMSIAYEQNPEAIVAALAMKMPFGKYAGTYLIDLPEPYLVWFHAKGFPEGYIGQALALAYEVKLNVLEAQLKPMVMAYIKSLQN